MIIPTAHRTHIAPIRKGLIDVNAILDIRRGMDSAMTLTNAGPGMSARRTQNVEIQKAVMNVNATKVLRSKTESAKVSLE